VPEFLYSMVRRKYFFTSVFVTCAIYTFFINGQTTQVSNSYFDSLEIKILKEPEIFKTEVQKLVYGFREQGDSVNIAKLYYLFGKFNIVNTTDYPAAFDYLSRAIGIFDKAGMKKESAKSEMQIGLIYYLQRNYSEALPYFENAYKAFSNTGDTIRIRRTAYLAGLTTASMKQFDRSTYYFKIAKKYMSTSNDDGQSVKEYSFGMGIYYLNLKKADSAIHYFNSLYKSSVNLSDTAGIKRFASYLAEAFFLKSETNTAEKFAGQVFMPGADVDTYEARLSAWHLLYEIALQKKQFNKAVTYLNNFVQLKDSLLNEKNLFELASLKSKYLIDKAAQENAIREAQKQSEQQALISQQKTLKNIFIGGSVFGMVFIIFLVKANNQRKKKNMALADSLDKLKKTQQQLMMQERLASMGRISAGIAHEMRNPLNFVNNFAEISSELLTDIENGSSEEVRKSTVHAVRENLNKIRHHGIRAESIVKQLLDHSNINSGNKEATDINQLCTNYTKIALHVIEQHGEITCKIENNFENHIPSVLISQQEIGRAFINLFNNAYQALDEKSKKENFTPVITICTFKKQKNICISISDNGEGISSENLERIFEPFFTTRPAGKGSGLGLSIANDIVKSHGGELNIISFNGKTEFTIVLPV
jgi:two-component system, NtrC family, sensor kinase